ncbi:hypothetical protein OPIT5_13025 [Opitutaceae bacterium TAV5]|nr:hypothetical protein OPIT5_13025 [Opitutaceae bacterium TAV5]
MAIHTRFPSATASRATPINRRGFTLIELLTVIAIIGVLAAILIPTVGAVRKSAQAASCISNLRQIGVAMVMHAQANRDKLPVAWGGDTTIWNEKMWQWQLQPYLENKQNQTNAIDAVFGGIFRCPGKTNFNIDGPTDREKNSYAMNAFSNGGDTTTQRTLSSLGQPTITLLVSDSNTATCHLRNANYLYDNAADIALWHKGKNNMLFADGHVEALPKDSVNYYLMKTADPDDDSIRP